MSAPDAQPPAEPHDPTHLMYDADTGICCDCPRMVDPLAAPVAAALDSALSAFNSAVEFGTPDEVEHGITIALRAAFQVVPPAAALAGTTTPANEPLRYAAAVLLEQALRKVLDDNADDDAEALAEKLTHAVLNAEWRPARASTPTRTEETDR